MTFNASHFIKLFEDLADRLTAESRFLCELDGHVGDGDHGLAMAQGFSAIRKAVLEMDAGSIMPADVFNVAAKSFLSAVGASSGPLYASAFFKASAHLKGLKVVSKRHVVDLIPAMASGIRERGKAEIGEKTMIDAWEPAAREVVGAGDHRQIAEILKSACGAAQAGADSTQDMVAAKGRASRLGERSRGHKDPGAVSAAIIISVIAETFIASPDWER